MFLHQEMKLLQANFKHADQKLETVSEKSVAWHIHHSLLVMSGICYLLEKSNPKDYQPKFSFLKWGIMTFGIIPRGKARAPKEVVPTELFSLNDTQLLFSKVELQLKNLEKLSEDHFYHHHLFGDLKLRKSIYFIGIHTKHHLKIIRDILAKS